MPSQRSDSYLVKQLTAEHPWIPEMRQMPLVAVLEPDPGEIRGDTLGAERGRDVERVLARLAYRPPSARVGADRAPGPGVGLGGAVCCEWQ